MSIANILRELFGIQSELQRRKAECDFWFNLACDEFCKSIAANDRNDHDGFKKHASAHRLLVRRFKDAKQRMEQCK